MFHALKIRWDGWKFFKQGTKQGLNEKNKSYAMALFSSEKWKVFGTVALSFVCDKYYLIMN